MRRAVVLVALGFIALSAACDGGTDATPTPSATASPLPTVEAPSTVAVPTSTPSATATPEATPPSPPGPRRTGDPALDAIIEAVEARDVDALVGMLRTEVVECRGPDEPAQIGSPPSCEDEGVSLGTELTVATGASCEGYLTTSIRGLIERFVEGQDGLYAVVDGSRDVTHLIYHGRRGAASGLELWIVEDKIEIVQAGCVVVETRANFLGGPVFAGPWQERLTPYAEGVASLLAPLLAAVDRGDLEALQEMTATRFFIRGCGTSPDDPVGALSATTAGSLYGVYERSPDVWWLTYETDDGGVRLEYRTPQRQITELTFRCSGSLDDMATDGLGRALDPIELPSE